MADVARHALRVSALGESGERDDAAFDGSWQAWQVAVARGAAGDQWPLWRLGRAKGFLRAVLGSGRGRVEEGFEGLVEGSVIEGTGAAERDIDGGAETEIEGGPETQTDGGLETDIDGDPDTDIEGGPETEIGGGATETLGRAEIGDGPTVLFVFAGETEIDGSSEKEIVGASPAAIAGISTGKTFTFGSEPFTSFTLPDDACGG